MFILGLVENAGGLGDTNDSAGTTNIVSWKENVVPPAVTPDNPVAAGKVNVKA